MGARDSRLSRLQVREVEELIAKKMPHISFEVVYIETLGDKDKKKSLLGMEKSDFFTKEIEEMNADGRVSLSIHSAKDLPHRLHIGLEVLAYTKGLDPRDAIVFRKKTVLKGAFIVGTSSRSRERRVVSYYPEAICKEIRGTIEERLEQLECGYFDAIVIAEAALIRLGLTHLNRVYLKGATVKGQGQLALIGRKKDLQIKKLFQRLDCIFESNLRISR